MVDVLEAIAQYELVSDGKVIVRDRDDGVCISSSDLCSLPAGGKSPKGVKKKNKNKNKAKTKQNKTKRNETKQNKPKKTKQSKTKQSKTKQNKNKTKTKTGKRVKKKFLHT